MILQKYRKLQAASLYFLLTGLALSVVVLIIIQITKDIYLQDPAIDRPAFIHWIDLSAIFFFVALLTATITAILAIERNAREREKRDIIVNQMALAGEMSTFINHEFKNLLTILWSPIHKLKISFEQKANPSTEEYLNKIESSFSRLQELIRIFSAIGQSTDLKIEQLHIEHTLKDILYFCDYFATKSGVQFSTQYEVTNSGLKFYGNQILLTQSLMNLIKNSCEALEKAPEESKWIQLRVFEKNGGVVFQIIDGGNGIPLEIEKNLFKKRISTKGSCGSGLGLNIARKFILLQGGSLKYENEENTTFSITMRAV